MVGGSVLSTVELCGPLFYTHKVSLVIKDWVSHPSEDSLQLALLVFHHLCKTDSYRYEKVCNYDHISVW